MNPVKFGKTCLDQIKLKVNKPKKIRNEACQINFISKLENSIKPFQNVFFQDINLIQNIKGLNQKT